MEDGSPDSSFGEMGLVDFRANYRGVCERLIIHDQGVLVVGTEGSGQGIDDVFIARIKHDGSTDTTFHGDGYFSIYLKGRMQFQDLLVRDNRLIALCNIDTESQRHHKVAIASVHL